MVLIGAFFGLFGFSRLYLSLRGGRSLVNCQNNQQMNDDGAPDHFSAEMAGLSRSLAPVPEVRFATGTLP
jgi:hypothetical protein